MKIRQIRHVRGAGVGRMNVQQIRVIETTLGEGSAVASDEGFPGNAPGIAWQEPAPEDSPVYDWHDAGSEPTGEQAGEEAEEPAEEESGEQAGEQSK